MRDATALFRLIESLADTPTLIDAMTGVPISRWYGQVIWEGLASRRWKDEQLKTLERQLASIDLLARCDVGLQAEQTALNDWLPPDTCITASVRPCVGRTAPSVSGIQSIWFLNTPVIAPCISGEHHTWASDQIESSRRRSTSG